MLAVSDPSALKSDYVLPPDYEIMTETAEVFTKALLLGMEPETSKSNFADDVDVLPFEEAVAYMRKRLPVDGKTYYALADKMRYRAFTVSRLADGDAVRHVQSMLVKAMDEGSGIQQFLQLTEGQLADAAGMGRGAGWYYETVYRTNTATAYNVGRAIGFEETPPIALELIGIDDTRQTEICHALTVPPFRRSYGDPVWEHMWPPFHFNCRTTVRAIYDESEIEDAGGPDKFYSRGTPDYTPDKGFGTYPLDKSDSWWNLTDAMEDRAEEYGLVQEFVEAKEKLIEGDKNLPNKANSFIIDEEKVAETLHRFETSLKDIADHEEGAIVGLDGRLIHVEIGKKSEVSPPSKLVKGNIFTHNHPSGKCALSVGDVCTIISDDGYEARAVTRDGRFVSLRKGTGEINTELGEAMRAEFPSTTDLYKKAGIRAIDKYGRGNYNLNHMEKEVENLLNEWIKKNAPEYGYIFKEGLI
jgi:hypothetical protein